MLDNENTTPPWSVASWAMQLAGSVWTRPGCTHKVMDIELAREFAKVLEEKDTRDAMVFKKVLETERKSVEEQTKRDMLLPKTAIANLSKKIDAQEWACNFLATIRANPHLVTDESFLIGWFANAIMTGFDEGTKRTHMTATEATARTEELQHEAQCICGLHWKATETAFAKGVLCDCGRVSKVVSGLAMFKVEWENRPPMPCSKCESQSPNGSEFATASTNTREAYFPESMLQEAERLTDGDRRELYGSAVDNFRGIADAFNAATGHHITPAQVGLFNLIQKICREGHAHKRDNLVDIAGYAKLVQQVHEYSATK